MVGVCFFSRVPSYQCEKKKRKTKIKEKKKAHPAAFIPSRIHPRLYSIHLFISFIDFVVGKFTADEDMDENRRLTAEVFIHIFSSSMKLPIDVFIQPTQGCGARSPGMEYSVERGERRGTDRESVIKKARAHATLVLVFVPLFCCVLLSLFFFFLFSPLLHLSSSSSASATSRPLACSSSSLSFC